MVVIYTQDGTYLKSFDNSKDIILELYGEKLGADAIDKLSNSPIGTKVQYHGGPLIQKISKDDADKIYEKETSIGTMLL